MVMTVDDFLSHLKIGSKIKINDKYGSSFSIHTIVSETKTTFKLDNGHSFKKKQAMLLALRIDFIPHT